VNFRTVKSRRKTGDVDGLGNNFLRLLRLYGECAKAQQRQKDAGQNYEQAN
jgi:hypothetical protein